MAGTDDLVVDLLLREIFAAELATLTEPIIDGNGEEITAVNFTTVLPPDVTDRLPLVFAHHTGGSEIYKNLADRAAVVVDVYAADKVAAARIAGRARSILRTARRRQTVYPSGHLSYYENPVAPFRFPDRNEPCPRVTAEYVLGIRPPA